LLDHITPYRLICADLHVPLYACTTALCTCIYCTFMLYVSIFMCVYPPFCICDLPNECLHKNLMNTQPMHRLDCNNRPGINSANLFHI